MKKLVKAIIGKRLYGSITQSIITKSIQKVVDKTHNNKGGYTAQSAIDLLFAPEAKYIRPWQHIPEILEVAKLIDERKPKTILEIGTASGGTLFLSALLADPSALIVSIDLQYGMYGGGYPDWKIPLYKSFKQHNQQIELIQGDSHSAEIHEQLRKVLNGRKIDYLFIDGDHTYDGVKQDFEVYSQFLSDDAFVSFHDIVSDKAPVPDHFVSVYWNDIKGNYPHKEFIQDPNQNKLGLGVLFVKK
ncbi:MAG: class I SAM-dependent methyltransferase [Sphingobacteriales bacterium JAD_PAG50586_3]|nr:MAG: class I SAM-dependent methyltransferase [Sphingobacteriales bacterium JAD_PAG50586_3]